MPVVLIFQMWIVAVDFLLNCYYTVVPANSGHRVKQTVRFTYRTFTNAKATADRHAAAFEFRHEPTVRLPPGVFLQITVSFMQYIMTPTKLAAWDADIPYKLSNNHA